MQHPPDTIDTILQIRDTIIQDAFDAVRRLEAAFSPGKGYGLWIARHEVLDHARHASNMEAFFASMARGMEKSAWRSVLAHAGAWDRMDPDTQEIWDAKIEQRMLGPLTPSTAREALAQLDANQAAMDAAGLRAVLNWDLGCSQPICLGRTMTWKMVRASYGGGLFAPVERRLNYLERRFALLDQQERPAQRERAGELVAWAMRGPTGEASTPYFRVQWFKNGNLRFHFLRPDLVERLNDEIRQAFPGALPAK